MKRQFLAVASYLFIISISANYFEFVSIQEWWIYTIVLLFFTSFFIITSIHQYKALRIIIYIILVWVVHALLTIPASFILGILMKNPEHVRTIAEHRAVFLFASLPIFLITMKSSKYFNREINE